LATSFNLQSHHQAIFNRINIAILSGSAHVWDPKNVYSIKTYKYKTGIVYILASNEIFSPSIKYIGR